MRKLVLIIFLALIAPPATGSFVQAQDVLDFGDPLPLPPPPLDDAPEPFPIEGAASAAPAAAPAAVVPAAPPLASPGAAPDNVTTIDLPEMVDSQAPAVAPAAAPSGPETPLAGKISGGRVNVRAGPNTQYESIAVLTTGAAVTVLSKHDEWYKIVYPADQLASIHKNYVSVEIAGEIPEAGVVGVVSQDGADIHAFYWDKSTIVGTLNKGDAVTVKQERGQWYRIVAPESARAYVFAEYVRVDGGTAVPADASAPPENPAIDLAAGTQDATGRLKLSENDRKASALKDAYFSRLQEQETRREEEAVREINRLEEAIGGLEARLKAIDAETANQLSYPVQAASIGAASWAPPDPLYGGFTGWIENIGRVGGAPASFRLSKGGEIRFYLRSDRFNLNDFTNRRVWVNGQIELSTGASANVLNIDQIRVLTEAEVAQSMPQPGAEEAVSVDGAPVYAVPTATDPFTTDPFAATVPGYVVGAGTPVADPSWNPAEPQPLQYPVGPQALPDHVGYGTVAEGVVQDPGTLTAPAITASPGEVQSDWYESPVISEVGP